MVGLLEVYEAAKKNSAENSIEFTAQSVTEYADKVFQIELSPEHAAQLAFIHERVTELGRGKPEMELALFWGYEEPLTRIVYD